MRIALKKEYHQSIYFFFVCFLAASIPLSNYFMSFCQLALCLNWLWEGDFKRKFANKQNNLLLGSILLIFMVHVLWLLNTSDFAFAFDDLRRKLPLLAIPLLLLTSHPLSRSRYKTAMILYCLAVFGGSVVGTIRSFSLNDIDYRNIIPFISHIRFSLNVCLVIFILATSIILSQKKRSLKNLILLLFISFFIYFLFILQSYTGISILLITGFLYAIILFFASKLKSTEKYFILGATVILLAIFAGSIAYYTNDYYTIRNLSKEQKTHTAQGNPYTHDEKTFIENGNFINSNISQSELFDAWNKRSDISIDEKDKSGHTLSHTLIRYLNSKNLPKDAFGVGMLTTKDIHNIELGIANYYYAEGNLIQKLTYRILFQIDTYKQNPNNVKGHSLLQRIELAKTGFNIVKENPFLGIGTGDVPQVIKMQLQKDDSQMKDSNMRIHNQYITFLVAFGIIGFSIILFALFFGIIKKKIIFKDLLFTAFLIIALLSMLSEDTLETEAGVTFFTFFFSFSFITSLYRTEDRSLLNKC